jgi:hydroxyethylthiazole kinase
MLNFYGVLEKVRSRSPLVHHITNWVTIYDCANVVKAFGASPVMAHAGEEVSDMSGLADSLVLNIGTLTSEVVASMKKASKTANKKGIPVVLDVCGAGATPFRNRICAKLMKEAVIDIVKGNYSEIASVAGTKAKTKGVDSTDTGSDMIKISRGLAAAKKCVVVATGKEDIITDGRTTLIVKNGHPMMSKIVGTGCMAASVIGAFAAVEGDRVLAAASALVCFEITAEIAAIKAKGPASFKEGLFDAIPGLDKRTVEKMAKVSTK